MYDKIKTPTFVERLFNEIKRTLLNLKMNNIKNEALSSAEIRLRDGAIAPLFRKYAIPSVIALLFVGLQTIIDGVILGNFVGANALASVSLILPCYSFIAAFAIVIGVGCQTLISIRLGEQNRQGANDSLRSAFLFLVLFSIVTSVVIYFFSNSIAILLGANDVLLSGSVAYLRAMIPFSPFIIVMFFSDYIIKSIGRPVYSMTIMSLTVILNIFLDLLFVAVWDMGTSGAGLATGISFTIGAMFNLPLVFFNQKIVSFKRGKFSWNLVWQMMYNGSSEGVSEISAGISTLMFNLALMSYMGESGVAAFTAINYVFFIGVIVFLGISDGIIPIISYNYGANQWSRVTRVLKLAMKTNFLIGCFIFFMLTMFGDNIISLFFKNGESDVIRIASEGTSKYAFAFFIIGLNILSASYFTAIANAKISIIISMLRGLIFVAICIYILPKLFGMEGIWYAVPISELCTLAISYYLVRKSLKQKQNA